ADDWIEERSCGWKQRAERPAVPDELDERPRPLIVKGVEVAQRELQVARLVPFGHVAVAKPRQPDDVKRDRHDDDAGHEGSGGPSSGQPSSNYVRGACSRGAGTPHPVIGDALLTSFRSRPHPASHDRDVGPYPQVLPSKAGRRSAGAGSAHELAVEPLESVGHVVGCEALQDELTTLLAQPPPEVAVGEQAP